MKLIDADKVLGMFDDSSLDVAIKEDVETFLDSTSAVVMEIPDNPTNGDMIKAMLNNSVYELEIAEIETVYCEKVVEVIGRSKEKDPNIIGGKFKPLFNCTFKAEWWSAPYKKE